MGTVFTLDAPGAQAPWTGLDHYARNVTVLGRGDLSPPRRHHRGRGPAVVAVVTSSSPLAVGGSFRLGRRCAAATRESLRTAGTPSCRRRHPPDRRQRPRQCTCGCSTAPTVPGWRMRSPTSFAVAASGSPASATLLRDPGDARPAPRCRSRWRVGHRRTVPRRRRDLCQGPGRDPRHRPRLPWPGQQAGRRQTACGRRAQRVAVAVAVPVAVRLTAGSYSCLS